MVQIQLSADSFTIRNDRLACVITNHDGRLAWSVTPCGGKGLALGPSAMPAISADGVVLDQAGHVEAREESRGEPGGDGARVLRVAQAVGDFVVTRFFQVYPDQPFVRTWGEVLNQGGARRVLTGSQILKLETPRSDRHFHLFAVEQFSWRYQHNRFSQSELWLRPNCAAHELPMGSFPSNYSLPTYCTWAAVTQGNTGAVVGIEFNGKSRLRACELAGRELLVTSTIDALNHGLEPGEAFEVPAAFVGLYEGDWDEAGYVTQRFCEAHVSPPMPDERYPWVQYDSWAYDQNINESQQMEALERCAKMGVEMFVLDLGWARRIGDWRVDELKFPRGLAPLADRARQLGIRLGLHIALAQAHPEAPAFKEHPDWLIHEHDDYFGAAPICLGHRPCREWLIGQILRLVDEHHVEYFLQDGEDMVKQCHKSTHTHSPGDSNYANSHQGLDVVIETVKRMRPNVMWENCEDGGCMMTFRMARLYSTSITVDNTSTYATRQGVYGASYPFSPRYSVRYMQDAPDSYTLRSAIFGGPMILMHRVTEWSDEQMALTRAAIEEYKSLRPLIRGAKIIHLLPPARNIGGDGWGWDAIQAVSPDRATSVTMVYRARGGEASQTIRPRGLDADARYAVELSETAGQRELTGAALANEGVVMELPEHGAKILRIQRSDS